MENLHRNFDAAGMMFRKALETALREKFPEQSDNLYAKIEALAKNNELTKDLAAWAHQIRLAGNEAAHEEEFTEEQAKNKRRTCSILQKWC